MHFIKFDFNNMLSFNVGKENGVEESNLWAMSAPARKAHGHLAKLIADNRNRVKLNLEWTQLPFQDKKTIKGIQDLGEGIAKKYENAIFLGIGGSYLGL